MKNGLIIGLTIAVVSLIGLIIATMGLPDVVTAQGIDSDGDFWTDLDGDCNDDDPSIFPGAIEIPDDGIDQNCDGSDSSTADESQSSLIGIGMLAFGVAVTVVGVVGWYAKRRKPKVG